MPNILSKSRPYRSVVVTEPATEPLTIHEARRHVEIAATNSDHDVVLFAHIQAAREQWERDTSQCLIARTMRLTMPEIYELQFDERPVVSISSITYYTLGDTTATLSTSVYSFDSANNLLRLNRNQFWPSFSDRWDAWQINYIAGAHADSTSVPGIDKQAMLLYVGYLFRGNRGDDDRPNDLKAYEALVTRHMRSSYP